MAITTNSKILASDVSGKVDTAGTGLSKSGTTLSLETSGVTAGSYGPSANASPAHGKTFSVPYLTVDTYGRLTACSTKTITLPAAGASAAVAYITAKSGSSSSNKGYRKYSDGFIIQWGRGSANDAGSGQVITFPTAFASTNYNISLATLREERSSNNESAGTLTKTGFTLYTAAGTVTFWTAFGF